jgi:hypothetical protein
MEVKVSKGRQNCRPGICSHLEHVLLLQLPHLSRMLPGSGLCFAAVLLLRILERCVAAGQLCRVLTAQRLELPFEPLTDLCQVSPLPAHLPRMTALQPVNHLLVLGLKFCQLRLPPVGLVCKLLPQLLRGFPVLGPLARQLGLACAQLLCVRRLQPLQLLRMLLRGVLLLAVAALQRGRVPPVEGVERIALLRLQLLDGLLVLQEGGRAALLCSAQRLQSALQRCLQL